MANVGEAGTVAGTFVEEDSIYVYNFVFPIRAPRCGPVLVGGGVCLQSGFWFCADADDLAGVAAVEGCGGVDVAKGLDVGCRVYGGDGVNVVCVVAVRAG